MKHSNLLPILEWLSRYNAATAGRDLIAALIVTLMLVPQSLAYAMLAGLPPHVGLYASVLPLVAYAVFGTSRALSIGPVAVVSLMTAAAIGKVAASETTAYAEAAIALASMSGLMLIAMSLFRLGFLANFLSHPVTTGFISASGILIAVSQLKHILGIKAEGETLIALMRSMMTSLQETNLVTAAIGTMTVTLLIMARKNLKSLLVAKGMSMRVADGIARAAPILVMAASVIATFALDLQNKGVKIVGDIPVGMPPFAVPTFDLQLWSSLAPAALLISLIGYAESISVAQALAVRRRQRISPNKELFALGTSNLASAFSGGFPVTGGIARSVVNFDAGAETPMAGAFTAVGILAASLILAPLFKYLPQAVLAATIIVAVLSVINLSAMHRTFDYSKPDFAALIVTMGLVLVVGVEVGIMAGILLSLVQFIWRTATPHVAEVGMMPGTQHFRNIKRHSVLTDREILSLRIDESLYFANAKFLEDTIYAAIAEKPELKHVVLMCSAVNSIDASALESLEAIAQRLGSASIGFHLSEVKGPVMDGLKRSTFLEHFKGSVFLSQFDAVTSLRSVKP